MSLFLGKFMSSYKKKFIFLIRESLLQFNPSTNLRIWQRDFGTFSPAQALKANVGVAGPRRIVSVASRLRCNLLWECSARRTRMGKDRI